MRRIKVESAQQFHALTQLLFDEFERGQSENLTWDFSLPEITGTVTDVAVAPDMYASRVRLHAHRRFTFEATSTFRSRMAKLAWIRDGEVSYIVRGARTDYDATEGQMYLAAFDGETRAQIAMNPGSRIDALFVVLPITRLRRLLARHGLASGQLLPRASHTSRHPFRFTTVITEPVAANLEGVLLEFDRSNEFDHETLPQLIAGTVRVLDDRDRWASRIVSPADIDRVRQARAILLASLDDPPGLTELAHRVGLNEFKLKAGFRQAFGSSVGRELQRVRLETARDIIRRGNTSITDAASQVGYSKPGDFGIRFKDRFGISPSEYRSRCARSVDTLSDLNLDGERDLVIVERNALQGPW